MALHSMWKDEKGTIMDIARAKKLAIEEMDKWGLCTSGWRFILDRAKTRNGACSHFRKIIQLSKWYIRLNEEHNILDTIRHEIAHALVDSSHGHDDTWKLKCIEVGAKPERCKSKKDVNTVKGNYLGNCSFCGVEIHFYKKPKYFRIRGAYSHKPCRQTETKGLIIWQA